MVSGLATVAAERDRIGHHLRRLDDPTTRIDVARLRANDESLQIFHSRRKDTGPRRM
jgi:hypothetical protein